MGSPHRTGPDEVETWLRPVGAARLRLAAAGGERLRPRHRIALLGRRVQRPLWIVKVRAAERAEIRAAGQDQRIDVVVRRNRADRDYRDPILLADFVADPVGVRCLVTAA